MPDLRTFRRKLGGRTTSCGMSWRAGTCDGQDGVGYKL